MQPFIPAANLDLRIDSWGRELNTAVGGLVTRVQNPDRFRGHILRFNSCGMEFTKLNAAGMLLQRGSADIDNDEGKYFFLIYQCDGNAVVEQGCNQTRMQSGDMVLLDSGRPFRIDYPKNGAQYCFHIPRDMALHNWRYARVKLAEKISADSNLAALIAPLLRQTARIGETAPVQGESDHLLNATLSLLEPLFTQKCDRANQHQSIYLQRAMAFIERHLRSEEISSQMVADHLGVSLRHLQRLFKPLGTSVSKLILENRICACARDLVDPRNADTDVTVIAFYWGFNDTSYFSRAFKNRYGISPSRYRAKFLK